MLFRHHVKLCIYLRNMFSHIVHSYFFQREASEGFKVDELR
jgi:hypothetical protein